MKALAAVLLVAVVVAGCSFPGLGAGRTGWAFSKTGLDRLADRGLDGDGVTVAIIDTGLDASHPAFDGLDLAAWTDLAQGRPEPYDEEGHGTYVASLVAGRGSLRGGAPQVSLVAVKVFDSDGQATDGRVAAGIRFAVQHGADVIGLSLGGGTIPVLGTATEDEARSAVARGILVVAAAGNEGPDNGDVRSPANVEGVIAVAAVDRDLRVADFSSRGAGGGLVGGLGLGRSPPDQKPEVSAPGVDINGAWLDGKAASASGTSSAVPFVVAALALVLQAHPGQQPKDAAGVETWKRWLMDSAAAVPDAAEPHDRAAGYGFLDAVALEERAR
jgi:subtilisin family serine protease